MKLVAFLFILYSLLPSCLAPVDSLGITSKIIGSYCSFDNTPIMITEYTLTNTTQEPYYTWVDFDKPKYLDKQTEYRLKRYFFKSKGDFSVHNLLTDNVVIKNEFPILGYTWFVEVPPGETFRYIIISKNNSTPEFENCIESLPKVWLEEKYLAATIPTFFKYNGSYIVIDTDNTSIMRN